MAKARKNPVGKAVVWVVLLLLIVGLAGFGATSFGGSTRTIGSVGETEIGMDRYARALEQEIRAYEAQTGRRITMAEARQIGLDRSVLQRLVALAALEDEAAALGISVGDARIAREIQSMEAFQGIDGNFDREAYAFALDRAGLTVAEFEAQLRDETARSLLQGALVAGIQPPAAFIDALYDHARETRDLTVIRFSDGALSEPVPEPDETELRAYYEDHPDAFTLPERKRITYAWLSPEMMAGSVEVNEEAVREIYDSRADEFDRPETRLVERLVFPDAAAAEAARAAIAAGETDFETLVAERGLELADVDLGAVARTDLGAAGEAVFAPGEPGIVGPADTGLGPALFRVNAILAPQKIPFEEVAPQLRDELAIAAARRAIADEREPVADLLAGGATLEEIAADSAFRLGRLDWSGGGGGEDGADIDAYETFREVAAGTAPGDFPELAELSDGGLFALRVDEVLAPELQPFEAVSDAVAAAWTAEARRSRIADRARAALQELRDGTGIDALGGASARHDGVTRDGFLEGLPAELIPAAFDLDEGGAAVIEGPRDAFLLRVDTVSVPGGATEEARAIKQRVRRATGQGIAEDITAAFTATLQSQKGISLNDQAVTAVLSQFN